MFVAKFIRVNEMYLFLSADEYTDCTMSLIIRFISVIICVVFFVSMKLLCLFFYEMIYCIKVEVEKYQINSNGHSFA